jgi:Uma2 family endonuclease
MAVESAQQIAREPFERFRFTVDDFMLMGEVGIFKEGDRVELIDGEVIRMNPIGFGHSGHVIRLNRLFWRTLGDRVLLSVQNPMQVRPRNQPQPDLMVLRPRADDYTTSHPTADDVLLMIEVADTSLGYDRDTKARVYAQAGIAEYWIVNLVARQIIVLRDPIDGVYRRVEVLGPGDSIRPLAFPDVTIAVSEILA